MMHLNTRQLPSVGLGSAVAGACNRDNEASRWNGGDAVMKAAQVYEYDPDLSGPEFLNVEDVPEPCVTPELATGRWPVPVRRRNRRS